MHVPLGRLEIRMPSELLNGPCRRSLHGQVGTERVSKNVNPSMLQLGCPCRMIDVVTDGLFGGHRPIALAEDERSPKMARHLERRRQPPRQRNISKPTTFGRIDMSLPHRPLNTELPLLQIDIWPLKRSDLSTSQARLPSQ